MTSKPQPKITMPELKKRGWTEAMVRDLLGEPDSRVPNPRYRSAAPMRLWALDRVTVAESGEEFAARLKAGKARSAASVAAADKRRKQLLDRVSAMTVRVPQLGEEELASKAIKHRNREREFREDFWWVNPDDPSSVEDKTLERWKVNYLRHALTNYERQLTAVAGKVGVRDAKSLIRRKVYDAISERYPSLAAECNKQYNEREGVMAGVE